MLISGAVKIEHIWNMSKDQVQYSVPKTKDIPIDRVNVFVFGPEYWKGCSGHERPVAASYESVS